MASSSSSCLALVTLPNKRNNYDVFVTFRGEDTRNNITDFLFDALKNKCISVFRDDTNLSKGNFIGPELLCAIEDSQIYVVIFSKNYASSTWCLQELEKIWEIVQVSGKHVLPVFYDVDPSEVRKQNGIFGEAFVKHEQRFHQEYEKVQRWRKALIEVGTISGWDLRHKPLSTQIKQIVQRIIDIMDCKSSCVLKQLVGMDSPILELENHLLLESVDEVRAIGICGMGGIGKTTIANALYARVSNQFGANCFIVDVNKVCRSHDGQLGVQKQILQQTLNNEHHHVHNSHDAIKLMQRRLGRVRTLLILDNVDHVNQLEILPMNREWLGAGSRVIIISRDEHILTKYGVDVVYKVPLLNEANSLELFCRQAFKLDHILNSYEGLVNSILHYTNGLPLAIEVLGSFLYNRNISEWKSALSRLKESPEKDVMDVLHLSFDGLKEAEKEIFLHIACFFNLETLEYVENVLNCCGFHAEIGLRVLIEKSLISIVDYTAKSVERYSMHNLLEVLGKNIVQENANNNPIKWKRLWFDKQLYDVMSYHMEKHVEAIVFNYTEDHQEMDAAILEKFSNLRLLVIKNVNVSGNLSCLSNKLIYVDWKKYPFLCLPSKFQPNKLVELRLDDSRKDLPNLKNLSLSGCKNLIKTPNFEEFPNLKELNLEGCISLVQLDASIGLLRELVYFSIQECKNLESIPNNIFDLSSLEYLNMNGCSKVSFDIPRHLSLIESASVSESTSLQLFGHSLIIPRFPLPQHTNFSNSLCSLYCLREVDISFCGLNQVPDEIGCLRQLESLNLGGNNFVTLPSLNELSKLVYLNLNNSMLLEYLPQLPFPTTIQRDPFGNQLPSTFKKGDLYDRHTFIGLHIFNCPQLCERQCRMAAFSWMTQFIQANSQFSDYYNAIDIVIPGSEIPSWFNNQSEGDIILIDNSPIMHDINNDIIGFICCSVSSIFMDFINLSSIPRSTSEIDIYMKLQLTGLNLGSVKHPSFICNGNLITVKTNHIWLTYFPRKSSWYVPNFHGSMEVKFNAYYGWAMGVMNCGYGWLHKQGLQEFNLTRTHSATRKRKILAIEDEEQQQQQQPKDNIHSSE